MELSVQNGSNSTEIASFYSRSGSNAKFKLKVEAGDTTSELKYTSTGSLVLSWGEPGKNNPGDFHLPHGIGIDLDGRIIVCDRENNRIQLFEENGEVLGIWTGFLQPTAVATGPDGEIYVSELQHRVSIVEAATGNILAQIGGQSTHEPGVFVAPH